MTTASNTMNMPSFEIRIDKVRLRGRTNDTFFTKDTYIARTSGSEYTAVARDPEDAMRDVVRHMRQHYRRLMHDDGLVQKRIIRAITTPCERIAGAHNDIRRLPVDVLDA